MLLVVVPLAFDPAAQAIFFPAKWLALCVLVPAGLAVAAATGALRWPAVRWWGTWLGVLLAATAVGVAPRLSALGAQQRNAGLLTWALAAGAFVLGASVGSAPMAVRWISRAGALSAGLVGIGAVLDQVGVDVFRLGDLDEITRSRSSWGSATFAAGHLVLVVPLALLHLRAADRRWRTFGAATSLAGVAGLVLTGTRGAWVGALVAAAIVAWPDRGRWRVPGDRRTIGFVGGAVLFVAVVAALSSPSLGRSTAVGRLDLWRVSTAAAVDRPVLGSGPDTQRISVPRSIDDAFEREHGSEEIHDRAHTLLLDTALTAGLIGVVAFAALLWTTGRSLATSARSGHVGRALAAGAAGYLVHLQFAFSESTLDPLAWLLAGTGVAVGLAGTPEARTIRPVRLTRWVTAGAMTLVAAAGGTWAGGELLADHRLRRALDERDTGLPTEAMFTLRDARGTAPARYDILQARARLAEELRNNGFEIDLAETALADLDAALAIAPGDPDLLTDRASALATAGRLDEARRAYESILDGPYPSSARVWLGLGVVAATERNDAEAERSWTRAAHLAPKDERPWTNLGLLHERARRSSEAERAYARALQIEPDSQAARTGLARVRG